MIIPISKIGVDYLTLKLKEDIKYGFYWVRVS